VSATVDCSTSPTLRLLVRLVGKRTAPTLDGEAPTEDELAWLLRAATTVPDHGALQPWRFVVVKGDARRQLGDALAADVVEARGEAPAIVLDKARRKAFSAPALIVLVASPRAGSNVPEWEQLASASCCGYAIVLAAHALGLGAVWKSTPFRDGTGIRSLFGLSEAEQLLGWVNVGARDDADTMMLRPIPDLSSTVSVLTADGVQPYRSPSGDHGAE
jgi:nitroreductase